MTTIGFIGGGRITAIFLAAWKAKGIPFDRVVVSDPNPEVRARLKADHPHVEVVADNQKPAEQQVVFLALHPPVLRAVLLDIAPTLSPHTVVVSLAPVVDFITLRTSLNGHLRLARMIPNAPSIIGKGYNPVAYGPGITALDRDCLEALFSPLGLFPELPESQLNAHAILTAMGPTYFWPQWQTLRDLGHSFGLDPETTDRGLAAMLHGAVTQLLERDFTFEQVMDTIPVKPLEASQAVILAPYREKLVALHEKLTGAVTV
ncbi:MAG TPA: NAD(P)-binding domain-containing protein [Holophaga sp.]|nr:NAD(P)-binding domain-containing protein [Holophaga sp.]